MMATLRTALANPGDGHIAGKATQGVARAPPWFQQPPGGSGWGEPNEAGGALTRGGGSGSTTAVEANEAGGGLTHGGGSGSTTVVEATEAGGGLTCGGGSGFTTAVEATEAGGGLTHGSGTKQTGGALRGSCNVSNGAVEVTKAGGAFTGSCGPEAIKRTGRKRNCGRARSALGRLDAACLHHTKHTHIQFTRAHVERRENVSTYECSCSCSCWGHMNCLQNFMMNTT